MRGQYIRRLAGRLCALAVLGCGGEPPAPARAVLAGIPIMPQSVPMASATGADAAQAVFRTGVIPDSVAAWYRRWFLAESWAITGDVRMPDGSLTLHAEKSGRPLWIMVQPGAGRLGSTYSLVGAQPDSGAAPPPGR